MMLHLMTRRRGLLLHVLLLLRWHPVLWHHLAPHRGVRLLLLLLVWRKSGLAAGMWVRRHLLLLLRGRYLPLRRRVLEILHGTDSVIG